MKFLIALDQAGAVDPALIGLTALNLAGTTPGFVLTTTVYHTAPHGEITPDVEAEIAQAYAALGVEQVDVLASPAIVGAAPSEAPMAFASFTAVQGIDKIVLAAERCWQSATSEAARKFYSEQAINPDDVQLAVVIIPSSSQA